MGSTALRQVTTDPEMAIWFPLLSTQGTHSLSLQRWLNAESHPSLAHHTQIPPHLSKWAVCPCHVPSRFGPTWPDTVGWVWRVHEGASLLSHFQMQVHFFPWNDLLFLCHSRFGRKGDQCRCGFSKGLTHILFGGQASSHRHPRSSR